jgi:hypothetical protein
MMQTAGNITFQQAATGATTTDTVNFFSDAVVPEPSSLLPLVSMIAGFRHRKIYSVPVRIR